MTNYTKENTFDRIRCYNDSEAVDALKRMVEYDEFYPVFKHVFPNLDQSALTDLFLSITGSYDFQKRVMNDAVKTVIKFSMDEFSCEGIKNLNKNEAYLYVANHRDIVMDAALLQHVLVTHDMNTTQITFGDNLMSSDFIIDFGKINKMFTVIRDSDRREALRNSQELSEYMRYVIRSKNESVWIAQRPGRTKDGLDETQQGLLRMFSMSGEGSFKNRLKDLNIVPLAISYEFEPCDYLKVYELCETKKGKYIKKKGEDFNSVVEGIRGCKGRTKLVMGTSLSPFIDALPDDIDKKEILKVVAGEIDRQIYSNYQLWPTNYIAYDMLNDGRQYTAKYTQEEKDRFVAHMNTSAAKLDLDAEEFKTAFLSLYANPIK
ncbi:1-acyl-sn-glycerol-3-phosphate acyltransferase [Labilibaculum sp. K2S]|uniref:1-acyl-sn-glycerol-3-phosphate acyltransferase n=1 Tax=Labilibaculum sp. K2S TaxID=3056386 RepID=UPI0025A3FDAA|nr:1-acyl-sn-glycerol-3-phosphate acyltransferase [Labilibaculum sp. K2S]MDM8158664.1 1-acyl-sn-glycerol-3-phosphate acyltransferase [Labilibaculum sp. K2S]